MKLTLHGKVYQSGFASLGRLTIGDARVIKREFGMSIDEVQARLMNMAAGSASDINSQLDMLAIIAYLVTSRSGDPVSFDELDRISIEDLPNMMDYADDMAVVDSVEAVELPDIPPELAIS